ncbi:hypothetical protein PGTUg99_010880 [Puccinia graminis f. sp. tritici]|uniref:Uncharacterized protein n=1 Tax=Puccinia graminis f. sp. tritici TaxID=56615 RepID=A0A5B0MQ75_PUCGR|nr:hypothetical protein PGTUg99_010880 [Puccinia graminis f. sp. tritici]
MNIHGKPSGLIRTQSGEVYPTFDVTKIYFCSSSSWTKEVQIASRLRPTHMPNFPVRFTASGFNPTRFESVLKANCFGILEDLFLHNIMENVQLPAPLRGNSNDNI